MTGGCILRADHSCGVGYVTESHRRLGRHMGGSGLVTADAMAKAFHSSDHVQGTDRRRYVWYRDKLELLLDRW